MSYSFPKSKFSFKDMNWEWEKCNLIYNFQSLLWNAGGFWSRKTHMDLGFPTDLK